MDWTVLKGRVARGLRQVSERGGKVKGGLLHSLLTTCMVVAGMSAVAGATVDAGSCVGACMYNEEERVIEVGGGESCEH